jgi:uncharacterized repeat protein (TIGR03803 family)
MSKLSLWKTIGLVGFFCAAAVVASPAQTFKTLFTFNLTDGYAPEGSLVQGLDGNFYGATYFGGANIYNTCLNEGCGTVFKITPGGTLTTLYSFCYQTDCTDGRNPDAGLVQATDGSFYGTTYLGGAGTCVIAGTNYGCGTAFKIGPGGGLTTLHSFCSQTNCTDGALPDAALVQATDGNFYGTTSQGGANSCLFFGTNVGCGTVFKITPGGTLTTLHSFDGTDGSNPAAALVQATDGNFYGTTVYGGAHGRGTVFKITPGGTLKSLYSFPSNYGYGANPEAGLVQFTDGSFFGTTSYGGPHGGGTVFRITPGGTLTTQHAFDGTNGYGPIAGLVLATNGHLYGTTSSQGANGGGTVYEIGAGGTLSTLYSFGCATGCGGTEGLVQATDGNFYGITAHGNSDGTVFTFAVGLGPFVETLPTSGEVGAAVIILGTDLTGATSVTFDGAPATLTVVSSSEITTTVPSGAATGEVQVTTPKGTLICNVNFRVTPTISSFSPASGPVGTSVVITGEGFRGATCISIGGVMATSFTVDSDTQITVTVPTGAKTGQIAVSTLGGTAVSAGTFTVN